MVSLTICSVSVSFSNHLNCHTWAGLCGFGTLICKLETQHVFVHECWIIITDLGNNKGKLPLGRLLNNDRTKRHQRRINCQDQQARSVQKHQYLLSHYGSRCGILIVHCRKQHQSVVRWGRRERRRGPVFRQQDGLSHRQCHLGENVVARHQSSSWWTWDGG